MVLNYADNVFFLNWPYFCHIKTLIENTHNCHQPYFIYLTRILIIVSIKLYRWNKQKRDCKFYTKKKNNRIIIGGTNRCFGFSNGCNEWNDEWEVG